MKWYKSLINFFGLRAQDLSQKNNSALITGPAPSNQFQFQGKIYFGLPFSQDKIRQNVNKSALEKEAFGGSPYVFVVINQIANTIAKLNYILVPKDPSKQINQTFAYKDCYTRLHTPNTFEKWDEFLYRAVVNYLVSGNCIIFGVRSDPNSTFRGYTALYICNTSNVTIQTDQYGFPLTYTGVFLNTQIKADKKDVLHLKKANFRNSLEVMGQSALEALGNVWGSTNAILEHEYLTHKNHGVNGIISSRMGEETMEPDVREKLQEQLNKDFSGTQNKGLFYYSPIPLDYTPLGALPKDLASNESLLNQFRIICAAFGVPPMVMGDVEKSTYNNMLEAKLAYYNEAILPTTKEIIAGLSEWYVQGQMQLKDYEIKVKEGDIKPFQEYKFNLSVRVLRELQANIITTEEARNMLYPETQQKADLI